MPSHLDVFVQSHSKKTMNRFVHEKDGVYSKKEYYQERDSLFIHRQQIQKIKDAGYVGKNLGQEGNDYGNDGILYGLFIIPKMELGYTLDNYGTLSEKKLFRVNMIVNDYSTLIKISNWKMEKQLMENFLYHGKVHFLME